MLTLTAQRRLPEFECYKKMSSHAQIVLTISKVSVGDGGGGMLLLFLNIKE